MQKTNIGLYAKPISNTKIYKEVSIIDIVTKIKTDNWLKEITEFYREGLDNELKSEFKKQELPFITASGIFQERTDKSILKYSNLIVLDFDNLSKDELKRIDGYIVKCPYVVMAFTSISLGKKIFIRNDDKNAHKEMFNSARTFFSSETNIAVEKIDKSGINLSRACFLCHDENAYLNSLVKQGKLDEIPQIELLQKDKIDFSQKPNNNPVNGNMGLTYDLNFEQKNLESNYKILIGITEKKEGEYQSPRQTWIHKLVCRCNKFGMSEQKTLEYTLKYFEHHPESVKKEKPIDVQTYIVNTIEDVYERYNMEFNSWQESEAIEQAPCFPCEFYKNLPPFLSNLTKVYKNEREIDIVLLAVLGILSSCFPFVFGVYDKNKISPNLFIFINGKPASGKGAIAVVRNLGDAIQKRLNKEYEKELESNDNEKQEEPSNAKSQIPKILKPQRKLFFIPANSSSIKIIENLSANKNFGVILDTEADTLSATFKNEWGNFSDIIRKVFHHETVEMQRKGEDKYITVGTTYLSLVLSGTFNQISNLTNVENGIFSRILFYDMPMIEKWKDVFDKSYNDLPETAFQNMGIILNRFIEIVNKKYNDEDGAKLEFKLTTSQEERFNDFFSSKKRQLEKIYGEDLYSSLHRLAVIAYRIAMLLSIIRYINTPNYFLELKELECQEDDFESALIISDICLLHTINVYKKLSAKFKKAKKPKQLFFDSLPSLFNRQAAMEVAKLIGMKEKTAEYNLKKFIDEGILKREAHNKYIKI